MQSPRYHQVLTGVVPYDEVDEHSIVASCIRSGERPLRPMNQDADQWLWDRAWDMITTCWSEDPKERWEVPAIRQLFSTLSLQDVWSASSGN